MFSLLYIGNAVQNMLCTHVTIINNTITTTNTLQWPVTAKQGHGKNFIFNLAKRPHREFANGVAARPSFIDSSKLNDSQLRSSNVGDLHVNVF